MSPNRPDEAPLSLGYDAKRLFANFTGLGGYSRTLLRDLAEEYPRNSYFLYTPRIVRNKDTKPFFKDNRFTIRHFTGSAGGIWRSFGIKKMLKKDKLDLYHGLSHELPYRIHKTGIPSVVTIHDLIYERRKSDFPYLDRILYRYKYRYAAEHADKVIAISENTRQDLIEIYDIPPDKITVVIQNCAPEFSQSITKEDVTAMRNKYELPRDYFLHVGAVSKRKNLFHVIKAWEGLMPDQRPPFVMLGKGGKEYKRILHYLEKRHLKDQVHLIPSVAQKELPVIYNQALCLLYVSYYEGLGLPVAESLYSGTPVIAGTNGALKEAGGPGALYTDPDDVEEIRSNMDKVITDRDLREKLVREGRSYVKKFNRKDRLQGYMNVYRSLI